MPFSPPDQARYDQWLQSSGILQKRCPCCGPVEWERVRPATLIGLDRVGGRWSAEPAGAIVPVVALTCPWCHLVVTYSLEAGGPFPAS